MCDNIEELRKAWQSGWDAYWLGQHTCSPSYVFSELRDEWMVGWFDAQLSDEFQNSSEK